MPEREKIRYRLREKDIVLTVIAYLCEKNSLSIDGCVLLMYKHKLSTFLYHLISWIHPSSIETLMHVEAPQYQALHVLHERSARVRLSSS